MRDLIEMAYKCCITPVTDCHKCKYYNECLLCEILDVLTGNAPTNNRLSNTNTNYLCRGRMNNEKDKSANNLENYCKKGECDIIRLYQRGAQIKKRI